MRSGADRRRLLDDARCYVIAEASLRAGRLADLAPALVAAGAGVIQLRDRSLDPSVLEAEAEACARTVQGAGGLFIVNDDVALAERVGADGVHLGQTDGALTAARARLGPDALLGRTSRGHEQLVAAEDEGADYASVSPVWETPTKPGRAPIGLAPVAAAARTARIPWFPLGSLDVRRSHRVAALGARRVAAVRAFTEADDPAAVVRAMIGALDTAPRILTIAGSDSGGGAGIQADTKAIVTAGGFPMTAITALTAQSTVGVDAVHPVPPEFVRAQIHSVVDDIGLDGVKTGMLADASIVAAVADAIRGFDPADEIPVVVDPVMLAESGARLLSEDAVRVLRDELLPLATVITPNYAEAGVLAGRPEGDPADLARVLAERRGGPVIVTGGHGPSGDDVLCDAEGILRIEGTRLPVATTHGAGCTHSATLATLLGSGLPLREAASRAKAVASAAVAGGRPYGAGAGPVDVTRARPA